MNEKIKSYFSSVLIRKEMFYRLFRIILFVDEMHIISTSIVVGKTSPTILTSLGQHRPIASTVNRYANCWQFIKEVQRSSPFNICICSVSCVVVCVCVWRDHSLFVTNKHTTENYSNTEGKQKHTHTHIYIYT